MEIVLKSLYLPLALIYKNLIKVIIFCVYMSQLVMSISQEGGQRFAAISFDGRSSTELHRNLLAMRSCILVGWSSKAAPHRHNFPQQVRCFLFLGGPSSVIRLLTFLLCMCLSSWSSLCEQFSVTILFSKTLRIFKRV